MSLSVVTKYASPLALKQLAREQINRHSSFVNLPQELLVSIFSSITNAQDQKSILLTCHQFSIIGLDDAAFGRAIFTFPHFISAVRFNHYETVRYFLKINQISPKFNPADGDNKAILQASKNGCIENVVKLLREPNIDAIVAFSFACHYGHLDIVKIMLEHPKAFLNSSAE